MKFSMPVELMEELLERASTKTGVRFDVLNRIVKNTNNKLVDRRKKFHCLAGTCSWNYNERGSFKYDGCTYYYEQNGKDNVSITGAR